MDHDVLVMILKTRAITIMIIMMTKRLALTTIGIAKQVLNDNDNGNADNNSQYNANANDHVHVTGFADDAHDDVRLR